MFPRSVCSLTFDRLKEVLTYDPDTGIFIWKINRAANKTLGKIAGTRMKRDLSITVDGMAYKAHRLAWLYSHGEWPDIFIDHINGNAFDNRLINLRQADPAINSQNRRKAGRRSKTGLLGISPSKGKFRAHIQVDGKTRSLGTYSTPEQAHQVYLQAKRRHHEGCTI